MKTYEVKIYNYNNEEFIYIINANSMLSASDKAFELHKGNSILRKETREIRN